MNLSSIERASRSLLGVPYRHHGRSDSGGLDCVGLLLSVGKKIGSIPEDFDFLDYPPLPKRDDGILVANLDRFLEAEDSSEKAHVFVAWIRSPDEDPRHSAIITRSGTMIHCCSHARKVVEIAIPEGWRKRMAKFYKFPEVGRWRR